VRIPARVQVRAAKVVARAWPYFPVRRPVFIIGSGRSGTSLLEDLFDLHPDVANFPTEANELWHPRLYPYARATVRAPVYWQDPVEFTRISLANQTRADDRHLVATFGAYQAMARGAVFLNKSVMINFMLDRVIELFPGARFVHLFRDGRAVAASWVLKDRDKLASRSFREKLTAPGEDKLLEEYLACWQATLLAIADADRRHGLTAAGRLHELGYEELCADPRARLADLARFIGVSEQPFLAGDLGDIRNTNTKSRDSYSADRLARLNELAREGLAAKGYGPQIV
jgi:hypothetical protein